jgi:hypothetical protein
MGEWVEEPAPLRLLQPLLDPLIVVRNKKALDRLEDLAQHGARTTA